MERYDNIEDEYSDEYFVCEDTAVMFASNEIMSYEATLSELYRHLDSRHFTVKMKCRYIHMPLLQLWTVSKSVKVSLVDKTPNYPVDKEFITTLTLYASYLLEEISVSINRRVNNPIDGVKYSMGDESTKIAMQMIKQLRRMNPSCW